jgi:ATP-dependent exoDNAse (exonuclease V) beta subunit
MQTETPTGLPIDAGIRAVALAPGRSFLIQAPAGSGKTELLIQRYLRLLATVMEPEEILAITFTRKAAAEMRGRILEALKNAREREPPGPEHLQLGYELAQAALQQDQRRAWRLTDYPSRLRIGTIDSVNAWLAGRTPLSAGASTLSPVSEDPQRLYSEAARETIGLAAERDSLGAAIRLLLAHCDNRAARLEGLLASMLARRDQWLPLTGAGPEDSAASVRAQIEAGITSLVEAALRAVHQRIPEETAAEIVAVLSFAARNIADDPVDAGVLGWRDANQLHESVASAAPQWRFMAQIFLTAKGSWRRRLDKMTGFPPDRRDMKQRASALLAGLTEIPGLEAALRDLRSLPDPRYQDTQWQTLDALLKVLPVTAAQLKQVFAEQGATDFTEVAQEALGALGSADDPSELSLALDYRLQHILLDEFQDTSGSQFELLKKLTSGWVPDDGRTLFLVGDPMQSIYRFREAEVGIFLDARHAGIGLIKPEFLRLETNFRSAPRLVAWCNEVFRQIMPAGENRTSGAVPFSPSAAYSACDVDTAVQWHTVAFGDTEQEAGRIAALVAECRQRWPGESVGILVRSRSHAKALAPALQAAGIGFTGADLERLEEQPAVQDLLALTLSLSHLGDRLAWLAVLRAPWCGVSLKDLHALAAFDRGPCIWTLMSDPAVSAGLSPDGQSRIRRVIDALRVALASRGRLSLRDLVELAWLRLGGPATLLLPTDLALVDSYLELLDEVSAGATRLDRVALVRLLRDRSVTRAAAGSQVHVMTMHKAKGLEFDTVILPGLGYRTRKSERPVLLWREVATVPGGSPTPVFAPLQAAGAEPDPIYDLFWDLEKRSDALEQDRLLYVAVTRARRRLHLFAQFKVSNRNGGSLRPEPGSLLQRLWSAVPQELSGGPLEPEADLSSGAAPGRTARWGRVPIRRFPTGWQTPPPPPAVMLARPSRPDAELPTPEYDWAARWSMQVGTVVHRWLRHIAELGSERFDRQTIRAASPQIATMLKYIGTADRDVERAVERVTDALCRTLVDPTGVWILSASHQDAASEYSLTANLETGPAQLILDRTFVSSDGERWIVDYKTSTHEGGGRDAFLESEARRYQPQLKRYRDAMAMLDDRRIRTALYFPLLSAFCPVDADDPRYSE